MEDYEADQSGATSLVWGNRQIVVRTTPRSGNSRLLSRPSEDPNEANSRMTKPFNEYACLRDCLIRWHYGEIATAWPVPSGGTRFEDMHLLTVPPPVNNHLPAAGDCLLWRGSLTGGGYAQGQRHRQAYLEANCLGHTPHNINHLCHRPFCVQPGHLYGGDAQDNADDRRAKEGKGLTFDMLGGQATGRGSLEADRLVDTLVPPWPSDQATRSS